MKLTILDHEEYSWLKKSYFYYSLDLNDKNELDVIICPIITDDINLYSNVIDFWGVYTYPDEFYNLFLINRFSIKEHKFLSEYLNIEDKNLCNNAVIKNDLKFLIYLHKNNYYWDSEIYSHALINGSLECLIYVHQNNCPNITFIYGNTLSKYNFECIKYLFENKIITLKYNPLRNIEDFNLKHIKYLLKYFSWGKNNYGNYPIAKDLESLKCLHENLCPWDRNTSRYYAENGLLDCLIYCHENGCDCNGLMYKASYNGHLNCLIYLHKCNLPYFKNSLLDGCYNSMCRMYIKNNM